MRQILRHIAILERVDQLIRLKATGRPQQLASKLEVSVATVFRIIDTMKELEAPVTYDPIRQSYVYSELTFFRFGFFRQELSKQDQKRTFGGRSISSLTQMGGILTF